MEEELEKALFNKNLISECNFGELSKIGWNKASRTDKYVSAAMNVISCKLHYDKGRTLDSTVADINKALPEDIRTITMIEVSNSFNAKDSSSSREYHYLLPAFCLRPQSLIKSSNDIYDYKISLELHENLKEICWFFNGTKKYHNFTKNSQYYQQQVQRVISQFSCDELLDFEGIQYIKFKFIGQSFLYNQIRKMIGIAIKICRESLSLEYLNRAFSVERIEIPKAPAQGLYLYKVDYSSYNEYKIDKKNFIDLNKDEQKKIDDFSKLLQAKVHESEIKDKVFSTWLLREENNEYEK